MIKRTQKIAAFCMACALVASCKVDAYAKKEQDGPTMDAVNIYRNISSPEGEVLVGVDAHDKDGIKRITVYLKNDATGKTLSVDLKEKPHSVEALDNYTATYTIPSNTPEGLYQVECVVLTDNLENKSRYFREEDLPSGDDVYIIESVPELLIKRDNTAPNILGLTVNKDSIKAGSSAYVTLTLGDRVSGIDKASIIFKNPVNGRRLYCFMRDEDLFSTGVYRKQIEVPQNEPSGNYELFKITTKDIKGNDQAYCNNGEEDSVPLTLSDNFYVYSSKGDEAPPVFQSVQLGSLKEDPDNDNNMQYFIKVKATDDVSGIHHISVRFKNLANDRTVSKVLKADDLKGGYYTGWMDISKYEPNGTFVLDNVGLTDNANNYQAYCRAEDVNERNHKLPLPKEFSFSYGKGKSQEDEMAPVWNSMDVQVKNGKVSIKMNVSDDISGVDEVRVQFKNYLDKAFNIKLSKNGDYYYGSIKEAYNLEEGTYKLTRVSLKDKAGNRRVYSVDSKGGYTEPLIENVTFTIED